MRPLKHGIFYSGTAVCVRAALPHTGSYPKEQVRIKKSYFDNSDVTTASMVGAIQCLFGVYFLTMQPVVLRIVGMVNLHQT